MTAVSSEAPLALNVSQDRAPTVEFPASVNSKDFYMYYVPGCCTARAFLGAAKGKPEEIIEAIVTSGVGGNVMFFTDAYTDGSCLIDLKNFVAEHELGEVTISASSIDNQYTDAPIWSAIYNYDPNNLLLWLNNRKKDAGESVWEKPANWLSTTDRVHMDSVFYLNGGRPKKHKDVNEGALATAFSAPAGEAE